MRTRSLTFRIIRARNVHVNQVVPLFRDYLKFYKTSAPANQICAFLRERLRKRESVMFLALSGKKAVGFVQLYPLFSSLGLKRSWLLNDLFVVPSARKCGVAKALMEHAHKHAVQTKAEGLMLETARTNRAAQRLYESLGWKRDREFLVYHQKC